MGNRRRYSKILQEAKKEAITAVDLYNRAYGERRLEAFIVHMSIAWLYLAHAVFARDGIDYRYRDARGHFIRVDGEPKTWELGQCMRRLFPEENSPTRRNIEFFIPFRNKIEHRYAAVAETVVAGRIQSNILNFEEKLVGEFGPKESLGHTLRFPVFLSSLTEDAVEAAKRAYRRLPVSVRRFISQYDAALPEEVRSHPAYEFKVVLIQKTGSKSEADAAISFIRATELSDEDQRELDRLQVIVRDREREVFNKSRLRPTDVVRRVGAAIPFRFTTNAHSDAWRNLGVRPAGGTSEPAATDDRYCIYDEPHRDYLYTEAWVERLVRELQTEEGFVKVVGRQPSPKSGGIVQPLLGHLRVQQAAESEKV